MNCQNVNMLRIMHQNIAGFLSKRDVLEITLYELSTKYNRPIDILCLSETFIQQNHELNIQLKQYKLGSIFCRFKQKRGGVCIIHHNSVEIKQLPFVRDLSCELTFECCGIELINYKIILVCIYKIPESNARIFLNKLDILLSILKRKTNKSIVLTGDWNIDTLKDTNLSRDLKELLDGYDMVLHIKTPTRRRSCLDHFASNIKEALGYTIPVSLSDH